MVEWLDYTDYMHTVTYLISHSITIVGFQWVSELVSVDGHADISNLASFFPSSFWGACTPLKRNTDDLTEFVTFLMSFVHNTAASIDKNCKKRRQTAAFPPHCAVFLGVGMDCCVIPLKHGRLSLVQTTDFFYPLVEDPYMMVRWLNNQIFVVENPIISSSGG